MTKQQLDLSCFNIPSILCGQIPKLKCKKWTNNKTNQTYHTIRYNKLQLQLDDYHKEGLLRSLVLNNNGKVLSFSPPKSYNFNIHNYSSFYNKDDMLVVEEFVDGTMINLFWDDNIKKPDGTHGEWEITTRSCVSANIGFYLHEGSRTFRDMFFETCKEIGLIFEKLPKKSSKGNHLSYSFVLQHKDNRIVVPYNNNTLYLIDIYEIEQKDDSLIIYSYDKSADVDNIYNNLKNIQLQKVYLSGNAEKISINLPELMEKYASNNTPYYIQGLVIKNLTQNSRLKIRNPVYEEVRRIRGNQPKIQFRYLTLRQQNKVKDYLKYYPEDKESFLQFRKQLHIYTNTLYSNYINCFIKKQKPLREFPYKYRNHMVQLHKHYIDNLRELGKYITKGYVIQYMNSLPPPQQMYVINYDLRTKNIDTIVADSGLQQVEL